MICRSRAGSVNRWNRRPVLPAPGADTFAFCADNRRTIRWEAGSPHSRHPAVRCEAPPAVHLTPAQLKPLIDRRTTSAWHI